MATQKREKKVTAFNRIYFNICGTAMLGNLVLSNDKGAGTSSFKYLFYLNQFSIHFC